MKSHRESWFNKVTPFSKTVAIIIFIALPFIYFFFGVKYGYLLGFLDAITHSF